MTYAPQEALELFDQGASVSDVVRAGVLTRAGTPVSARRAREWRGEWKRVRGTSDPQLEYATDGEIVYSESSTQATLSSTSRRITTLEQLIRASQVDMSLWRVDRYVVNKWEGYRKQKEVELKYHQGKATGTIHDTGRLNVEPPVQIKVWLARRAEKPYEDAIESALRRLAHYAPEYSPSPDYVPPSGEYLFSPQLYDVHFNRRSADGTYTLDQASSIFRQAGEALIARAGALNMPISRILLPVGNDILNADTLPGTTTRGTWQELVADMRDAIDAVCESYTYLIERLASVAPVDVVMVESNHDRLGVFWLGKVLEARFSKHPQVLVDASRGPRKYYRYGKVLLGLEHGDRVRPDQLALIMAQEAADLWSQTTYREWLRGHIHTEKHMYHQVIEARGVVVRVIPALCPPSEWELLMGMVGNRRAAEGLYYHGEYGPAGSFPVFVEDHEKPT